MSMEESPFETSLIINEISSINHANEVITQENFELKKKIERLETVNLDLESELTDINNTKVKELSKYQTELENATAKIRKLELLLEEEQQHVQKLTKEANANKELTPEINAAIIVPDQEQLNILTNQIEQLELKCVEEQATIKELLGEKSDLNLTNIRLISENKLLHEELTEIKQHLEQKSNDLRNANEALESAREEKLLLNAEVELLKSSDTNASRGNSLFAEVEENRQKVAAQRELLKLKYINLKKVFNQKQVEVNKLKMEIIKMKREEKDDEKSIHRDYSNLIETYKKRVSELEQRIQTLEQKNDQPPIVISHGAESSQSQWVHTVVENARDETRALQKEMDRRGSNYVVQGHQLFNSQKENRKLRALNLKLQSEIDELRLKFDTIKSANENLEDGISPPATEVAIEYQKQKTVKFKEVLLDSNKSFNNCNTSPVREPKSLEECNTSLSAKEGNDKENLKL